MTPDVTRLIEFYRSPLGRISRALVREPVRALAGDVTGKRVLGLGFATPYLRFTLGAGRARGGVHAGAAGRFGLAARGPVLHRCSADPLEMPFTDSAFDLIVAVHALEHVADAEELMRELWRIAAPNARLIVVVPRRRGPWAARDNTPFGYGNPYLAQPARQPAARPFLRARGLARRAVTCRRSMAADPAIGAPVRAGRAAVRLGSSPGSSSPSPARSSSPPSPAAAGPSARAPARHVAGDGDADAARGAKALRRPRHPAARGFLCLRRGLCVWSAASRPDRAVLSRPFGVPMSKRPVPQPGILEIAPYVQGKSGASARPAVAIKLSSNESPLGASPRADRGLSRPPRPPCRLSRRLVAPAARDAGRGARARCRAHRLRRRLGRHAAHAGPDLSRRRRRGGDEPVRLFDLSDRHPGRRRDHRHGPRDATTASMSTPCWRR